MYILINKYDSNGHRLDQHDAAICSRRAIEI